MSGALVGACWLAARRAKVLAPVAGVLGLVGATVPWQDTHAAVVLHGAAVLTAAAVATGTDEPSADVAGATPYPRHVRTLTRLLVSAAVAAPAYVVGLAVADLRSGTPLLPLAVEGLVLAFAAAAAGTALQARGAVNPAYLASLGVLLLIFALRWLPAGWGMVDPQPWGPPLQAALFRWSALALLAAGVLGLGLRDPATR